MVSRRNKQKSQSISERKTNIACHHRHVCTVQKHTPFSVCNRTPSPIWLKCPCFQLPPRPTLVRHLGGLACVSRTSPPGVGRGAPPRFVDCPGAKLVAIQPVTTVEWRLPNVVAGAVVPLCQVTLLASSPSLHHAYHGSLVTPSVCFRPHPLCLPVPVCVMCDVTTSDTLSYDVVPCSTLFYLFLPCCTLLYLVVPCCTLLYLLYLLYLLKLLKLLKFFSCSCCCCCCIVAVVAVV